MARVHGQVLSRWRQGRWQCHLRLRGGGNAGSGLDPVRRRPVAREHHAAGGVAQELPESGRTSGHCDQHQSGRLPSDRADAAGAVRRQFLAADRRRDRERVRGRAE